MQNGVCVAVNFMMRFELIYETQFFGLDHGCRVNAAKVADCKAARPHSELGYHAHEANAAQIAGSGEVFRETDAVRRAPIAPLAQAGDPHPPDPVSAG